MRAPDIAQFDPITGITRIAASPSPENVPPAPNAAQIPAQTHDIDVRVEISDFSTNKLHQFNANFNSVLKSIRIADQSLSEIGTKLDQMTSEMQTFLKMYPPYPPGSQERVDLLKNYAAIRQQIEQFALPGDDLAGLLFRNGFADEATETYEVKIGNNLIGERIINDSPESMGNLTIPELHMTADDKQITTAAKSLGEIKSHLTSKRTDLMQVAGQLIEAVG